MPPAAKKMTKKEMKERCMKLDFEPYTTRPGPQYSAPGCAAQGVFQKMGRDGIMYTATSRGTSYVWRKPATSKPSKKPKASKPQKAVPSAPSAPSLADAYKSKDVQAAIADYIKHDMPGLGKVPRPAKKAAAPAQGGKVKVDEASLTTLLRADRPDYELAKPAAKYLKKLLEDAAPRIPHLKMLPEDQIWPYPKDQFYFVKYMLKHRYEGHLKTSGTPATTTALEYLALELLELAGNSMYAADRGKDEILVKDIKDAIFYEEEFKQFFKYP